MTQWLSFDWIESHKSPEHRFSVCLHAMFPLLVVFARKLRSQSSSRSVAICLVFRNVSLLCSGEVVFVVRRSFDFRPGTIHTDPVSTWLQCEQMQ